MIKNTPRTFLFKLNKGTSQDHIQENIFEGGGFESNYFFNQH